MHVRHQTLPCDNVRVVVMDLREAGVLVVSGSVQECYAR